MPTDESDAILSEAYNRASNEKSPESLDNAVLALARAELTTARSGWFQPLAIAATLVIGVGFALRITDYGTVATPELSAPAAPGADLGDYSAQEIPQQVVDDLQEMEKSLTADARQMAAPEPKRELEKRSASRAPQVEELSRQANERAQTELDEALRDLPATVEFEPKAAVSGAALRPQEQEQESEKEHACTEQSEEIAQWLDCIENLRENGDEKAALLAEEALFLSFPELRTNQ